MATKSWNEIKRSKLAPEVIARIENEAKDEVLAMELRELRELAGLTQVEVARAADMAQADLSRFERRDDHLLSRLRSYIAALGGELEVTAVLGNKRIALKGV